MPLDEEEAAKEDLLLEGEGGGRSGSDRLHYAITVHLLKEGDDGSHPHHTSTWGLGKLVRGEGSSLKRETMSRVSPVR